DGSLNITVPWVLFGFPSTASPFAGCTDYALNKGANAYLDRYPWDVSSNTTVMQAGIPVTARGPFDTNSNTTIGSVTDGTSNTIMIGEVCGGSAKFLCRLQYTDTSPALDGTNGVIPIDQAWGIPIVQNATLGIGALPLTTPGNPCLFGSFMA